VLGLKIDVADVHVQISRFHVLSRSATQSGHYYLTPFALAKDLRPFQGLEREFRISLFLESRCKRGVALTTVSSMPMKFHRWWRYIDTERSWFPEELRTSVFCDGFIIK